MNFALVIDSGGVDSYISKEGSVYLLSNGKPYYRKPHISNECLMGFWNYPVLFDGYLINLKDGILPDIELDVIFAALERDTKNLDMLREEYPNARIYGSIKEFEQQKNNIRQYMIDNTDGFIDPLLTHDFLGTLGYDISNIKSVKIPQPINIEYFREHYLVDKLPAIFNYENHWQPGRGGYNHKFLQHISGVNVIQQSTAENWLGDFVDSFKQAQYQLNLDPMMSIGQQATQCAALGIIMIGGCNDANYVLFPEFAGVDIPKLLHNYKKATEDEQYRNDVINYALDAVQKYYSFESVKRKILGMCNTG